MSEANDQAVAEPQSRHEKYVGQQKLSVTVDIYEGEYDAFLQCWKDYRDGDRYAKLQALREADHQQWLKSLHHLLTLVMIRHYTCGSSYTLARWLASIYNGDRVGANLYKFGGIDSDIVEHAVNVLRLHCAGRQEIHTYFHPGGPCFDEALGRDGSALFEQMIRDYGLEKRRRRSS